MNSRRKEAECMSAHCMILPNVLAAKATVPSTPLPSGEGLGVGRSKVRCCLSLAQLREIQFASLAVGCGVVPNEVEQHHAWSFTPPLTPPLRGGVFSQPTNSAPTLQAQTASPSARYGKSGIAAALYWLALPTPLKLSSQASPVARPGTQLAPRGCLKA